MLHGRAVEVDAHPVAARLHQVSGVQGQVHDREEERAGGGQGIGRASGLAFLRRSTKIYTFSNTRVSLDFSVSGPLGPFGGTCGRGR